MKISVALSAVALSGGMLLYGQAAKTKTAGPSGETLYKQRCAGCHGADGRGQTAMAKSMKVPDLLSAQAKKETDQQLHDVIAKGKGKMTGYQNSLGTEGIERVAAHIRELQKK